MTRWVVGLGSNIEPRAEHLRFGVAACAAAGRVLAVSPLYETLPVGGPPQPLFLNAAVAIDSALAPRALLERMQAAEAARGRRRGVRWGPRPLDLDLLWAEGVAIDETDLQLPHSRLADRAFALLPLLAVAPDAVDPASGRPYRLQAPSPAGVRVVAEHWWPGDDR
jgi:2-amino-4-hydroxy-6-hydroxymethyldihydropteridine diphosphokinase